MSISVTELTIAELSLSILLIFVAFFTARRYSVAVEAYLAAHTKSQKDSAKKTLSSAGFQHKVLCALVLLPVAVVVRRYVGDPSHLLTYIGPTFIGTLALWIWRKLEGALDRGAQTFWLSLAVAVLAFCLALILLTFCSEVIKKGDFQDKFIESSKE
jgi:ABC-type Fe3+ transport system permease subunit